MSLSTRGTGMTSNGPRAPEGSALRKGLMGSFALHLAALAAFVALGGLVVQQFRPSASPSVTPNTPVTKEGHAQRVAQAKASLDKMVATLNRLEKIEGNAKPADEKAIAEAAQRAPAEVVQRMNEAHTAQKRASEALKRGEIPKTAQAVAAKAQERAKRAVSLLPKTAQAKVAPALAAAEKKQLEALRQAAKLAQQKAARTPLVSDAERKAALQAQRDAEAAMQKALAEAKQAMAQAAKNGPQQVAKTANASGAPHAPGEHTPKCFAPGGT